MAVSYITDAVGTNSATITGILAGDVVLAYAFRAGSNSQPTIPTGWTAITSGVTTNSAGSVCCYQIATTTSLASGTFTNSSNLVLTAYRGVSNLTPIGGSAVSTGASTTITYPAVTMSVTNGTSWVAGLGGTRSITSSIATAPTGMSNRASQTEAASELSSNDTNGGVSSWSAVNESIGGTSTGWGCYSVELIAQVTGVFSIVQTVGNTFASNTSAESLSVTGLTAGNTVIVAVMFPSTSAVSSVTDNNSGGSNTYTKRENKALAAGVGTMYVFDSIAVAGGATSISVNFATTGVNASVIIREYSGGITAFDVGKTGAANTGAPASGNTTTTATAVELVVGAVGGAASVTQTLGTGFGNLTNEVISGGSGSSAAMEDATTSIAGVQNAKFGTSDNYSCICVCYLTTALAPIGKDISNLNNNFGANITQAVNRAGTY